MAPEFAVDNDTERSEIPSQQEVEFSENIEVDGRFR